MHWMGKSYHYCCEPAKHINIRKHFAHAVIQNQHMRLIGVLKEEQLADIFSNVLPFPQFELCLMGLMGGALIPKGPWVFGGGGENIAQFKITKFNWELLWNVFKGWATSALRKDVWPYCSVKARHELNLTQTVGGWSNEPGLGHDWQREMFKVDEWAVVILVRMQTAHSARHNKTCQCWFLLPQNPHD